MKKFHQISCAKARLTARGDPDFDVPSLMKNHQTSAPTVSTSGKMVTMHIIASQLTDVDLGDVTGASLESDTLLKTENGSFDNQGMDCQDCSLNVSVRCDVFLPMTSVLKQLGWMPSAPDECVHRLCGPDTHKLTGALCMHVDDVPLGGHGAAHRASVDALRELISIQKMEPHTG